MSKFKVKYATRNRLAKSLQKEIQALGLVDTWALYDSIRISAVSSPSLNVIDITINALYYYFFLDEGTSRGIPPYSITDKWLSRQDVKTILADVVKEFIEWQLKEYPLLEMAKILNSPKVNIKFNWIDDPYSLPDAPTTAF